ncbi:Methylase of chemotaxis methyl-accepting proteins [Cryobacterium psychrotolerans]|uniref:Methylase of chemotaxis methyl-accepting proteins n=1 Tax=Cryobacterium psychrotolerans TaxID=386301 RepID=A0A1G9H1T5_9MICO|nr:MULTISPECIES: CheR family methyltransferase [Cryobacterium]TFD48495.1 hypothetical protein E3T33_01380 [Cryobacterium sp. TMT1-2-1]TFD86715.1 hypothetical protein E3T56_06820 [Cryobacterium psychrotolerans]SDL06523.1 Methylase of chemotaxis methyl-accepting proteins [Cryobacterium psychrotolerans]
MIALEPSEAIIRRVAELLESEIGLRPESALRARLRRCIRDELAVLGLDFERYLRALGASASLRQALLNRVTVQETGFFRHPEHFEILAQHILPTLPQPLSIWSAGCANGQEAFSLAMLLDELGIDGRVIATDVSTSALLRTNAASYAAREITGLSPERIARHLTPVGQAWEVNPSIRARVSTVHHNLIESVPHRVRSSSVVFCRNVLIYFSDQHARGFLDRVADALPQAWMLLGAAETIWSIGDRYDTVRLGDTYAYRPRSVSGGRVTGGALPARVAASQVGAGHADDVAAIAILAEAGRESLASGDPAAAVVSFRKWAYLAADDALAHLHLALALEAMNDRPSAQRAFGAAGRLLGADPARHDYAIDGYSPNELYKLLDAKQQELPQ